MLKFSVSKGDRVTSQIESKAPYYERNLLHRRLHCRCRSLPHFSRAHCALKFSTFLWFHFSIFDFLRLMAAGDVPLLFLTEFFFHSSCFFPFTSFCVLFRKM